MPNNKIKILGISGSLRTNSSATSVLKQAASLLPANAIFQLYDGLGQLPHFDDSLEIPAEVIQFTQLITEADGVLICTPEYAFGVPGSLKNALDWTVGSGEFVNKPVAVITAASVGKNAHASLLLTLSAISANVAEDAKLLIPFIRSKLNEKGEINDPALLAEMQHVVNALVASIEK